MQDVTPNLKILLNFRISCPTEAYSWREFYEISNVYG